MNNKISANIIIGSVVFLFGIAMLVFVFVLGYNMFVGDALIAQKFKDVKMADALVAWGKTFVTKAVAIILMTVVASCVTGKGIDILFKEK